MTYPAVDVSEHEFVTVGTVALGDSVKSLPEAPTIGVCFSASNKQPTVNDRTMTLTSDYGVKSISVSALASGTTYYYRVYVTFLGETYYGNVCSVTISGKKQEDLIKTINGHRFVDLGLPSGLLWAETNIGAENPEDAGNYYVWGETSTKTSYTKENSEMWLKDSFGLTPEQDAATVNWGSGVRMPTSDEFSELVNPENCVWLWTTRNGHNGYLVTSKSNGEEIFLPAAGGYYRDGDLYVNGLSGRYWSSTPKSPIRAYFLYFGSDFTDIYYAKAYIYQGSSVRAVAQ